MWDWRVVFTELLAQRDSDPCTFDTRCTRQRAGCGEAGLSRGLTFRALVSLVSRPATRWLVDVDRMVLRSAEKNLATVAVALVPTGRRLVTALGWAAAAMATVANRLRTSGSRAASDDRRSHNNACS